MTAHTCTNQGDSQAPSGPGSSGAFTSRVLPRWIGTVQEGPVR